MPKTNDPEMDGVRVELRRGFVYVYSADENELLACDARRDVAMEAAKRVVARRQRFAEPSRRS